MKNATLTRVSQLPVAHCVMMKSVSPKGIFLQSSGKVHMAHGECEPLTFFKFFSLLEHLEKLMETANDKARIYERH